MLAPTLYCVYFVGADAHIRPKMYKRVDVGIDPYDLFRSYLFIFGFTCGDMVS